MRIIIELTVNSDFSSPKKLLTPTKLNNITDYTLVSVRDIPFVGKTIYTLQADVSPRQLQELRNAGYPVNEENNQKPED